MNNILYENNIVLQITSNFKGKRNKLYKILIVYGYGGSFTIVTSIHVDDFNGIQGKHNVV